MSSTGATPRKRRSNRNLAQEAKEQATESASTVAQHASDDAERAKNKAASAVSSAKRAVVDDAVQDVKRGARGAGRDGHDGQGGAGLSAVKLYLVAYNLTACLSWLFVFVLLVTHVGGAGNLTLVDKARVVWDKLANKGRAAFTYDAVYGLSKTAYASIGDVVKFVQTLALLELVHSVTGIVRSGVMTTAMQLASRIFIVWYVCPFYPDNAASPWYATMVLAWSVTEVIRYAHYVATLLNVKAPLLEWLRYSTFYALYPLGATSEGALIYYSATHAQRRFGIIGTVATVAILALWPPSLLVMMSHMHKQRRRHLLGVGGQRKKTHTAMIRDEVAHAQEDVIIGTAETPARNTRSKTRAHAD